MAEPVHPESSSPELRELARLAQRCDRLVGLLRNLAGNLGDNPDSLTRDQMAFKLVTAHRLLAEAIKEVD